MSYGSVRTFYLSLLFLLTAAIPAFATEQFVNNCSNTLAAAITSTSATTLSMTSNSCTGTGQVGSFPSVGTYSFIIDSELITVVSVSGTTYTILRGESGTTAATHLISALVTAVFTKRAAAQMEADMEAANGMTNYGGLL